MEEDGDGSVENEWRPGNDAERAMAAALDTGDGARYAELLLRAPLLLPVLPAHDSPEWAELTRRIPLSHEHIVVYTSEESLSWCLGGLALGHRTTDLASLREVWREPAYHLAVNPGSPIAVSLPVDSVTALRDGREEIVPAALLAEAVAQRCVGLLRRDCLEELGAGGTPGSDVPAGALQADLWDAADRQDADAFLLRLLGSTVILPTEGQVAGPERIRETGFPWRTVGPEDSPLVPVFSSVAGLEVTGGSAQHHIGVPFVELLANWPGPDHTLCFDPGARTELILPGDVLLDLFAGLSRPEEP